MISITGTTRYCWRELLPRTVVLFGCIYLVMPHAPGLAFRGGVFAAICASLFFTAYFSLWGAHIMAASRVQKFIDSLENPLVLGTFNTAMMVLVPLLAILLAVFVASQTLVYTAWYGFLVWIVALHACCFATHDWRSS